MTVLDVMKVMEGVFLMVRNEEGRIIYSGVTRDKKFLNREIHYFKADVKRITPPVTLSSATIIHI